MFGKSRNKNILVYVIDPDITQKNKEHLAKLAQTYGSTCTVIDLLQRFSRKTNKKLRWPIFAISRLFLSDILPSTVLKVLLSKALFYCPDAVKYVMLYIWGIFYSVWLPEIRHVKNKLYLISR